MSDLASGRGVGTVFNIAMDVLATGVNDADEESDRCEALEKSSKLREGSWQCASGRMSICLSLQVKSATDDAVHETLRRAHCGTIFTKAPTYMNLGTLPFQRKAFTKSNQS